MPFPRLLVVACLALSACSVAGAGPSEPASADLLIPSPSPDVARASRPETRAAPGPDAWLPRRPGRLAERFTRTTQALHAAIDRWRASGGTAEWPPPREVVLLALDQQRIVQLLVAGDHRRRATIGALPWAVRGIARDIAEAGSRLRQGLGSVTVDGPVTMRTRAPLPPDLLRRFYAEAARRFDVPWTVLAAINFVESRFGRVISPSWAGARGPMQFIPSTWASYGMGGDVDDPRDAILGAANYLHASGAPRHTYRALLAYNPVGWYADAVTLYARQMRRDVRMFYTFYSWQVFVRLRSGLVQVTGPGADVRPQST